MTRRKLSRHCCANTHVGHFYFAKTGHYYIVFTHFFRISGGYVKFAYELTATKTLDSPYFLSNVVAKKT